MVSLVTAGTIGVGGIASLAGWQLAVKPLWSKVKPLWEIADILQGKNIEKHGRDAPKPLKDLEAGLRNALKDSDDDIEKACLSAEHALANFLSHSEHKKILNDTQLIPLRNFFSRLRSHKTAITQADFKNAFKHVEDIIQVHQGTLAKIKAAFGKVISDTKDAVVDQIRHAGSAPDESMRHPLLKIRDLEKKDNYPLKDSLLQYHLSQMEFKSANLNGLDQQIIEVMIKAKNQDPEGYNRVAKRLGLDTGIHFFSYSHENRDKFYVEYHLMRNEKPLLPMLPSELQWQQPTTYVKEKKKGFDLAACLGTFAVFKMRYGADELTKRNFYQTLSQTHQMTDSKRMEAIINFLRDERERLGTAWVPWAFDQYIFESLYLAVKSVSSQCIATSPFLENIKAELRKSPIPSMVFLGEKVSRYFHYMDNKYAEWCKDYPYDLTMDTFLKNKLYKRQESSQGNLNLDFFFSRYDLIQSLQNLSDDLYLWACSPTFHKDRFLSLIDPMLVIIKQLVLLPPRIVLQLLKLPTIFVQWAVNAVFMAILEQLLVHTTLFEKVDEVVTEALLDPSPYQFPLLEVVLDNLREVLEIIEQNAHSPIKNHPENHRAKRALKETIRTFVRFAKSLDSFNTEGKPTDRTLFEAALPPAIDKVFETVLRVHQAYSQKDDLEKRGTDFLQALNFYVYNKYKPTEVDEELALRHQKVQEHIALYIRKIANALIVQTSSEEFSEDIGNFVKKRLSITQEVELSNLMQNYVNRNKALLIEVIKKSYIMKGLFVHLITQEREA